MLKKLNVNTWLERENLMINFIWRVVLFLPFVLFVTIVLIFTVFNPKFSFDDDSLFCKFLDFVESKYERI